jgi:hypothetical protein
LTAVWLAHHAKSWIFIPYAGLIPYTFAVMHTTGVFAMILLVLQFIVAITLHILIPRRSQIVATT